MYTISRRNVLAGLGATAGVATFAGLPSLIRAAAQNGEPAGQITYSAARPIFTMDPRRIEYQEEFALSPLVNEPLVILDEQLNVTPLLATGWEALDDLTWEFTLQEGISFSNGEPFNASAVQFTFDQLRAMGAEYPRLSAWGTELPNIEVIDDYTFHLITNAPILLTPRNLVRIGMLPPGAGASEDFATHPIGTGPYLFVEHDQDVQLVLEANRDYWGGAPAVNRVVYLPKPEAAARLVAVQTGEVDIVTDVPPDLVPTLDTGQGVQVVQAPGVRLGSFNFNFRSTESPISDVGVRRALTQAIDGNALIEIVLAGAGVPLQGPVSAILWGAADVGGFPAFDPDQARATLAEAGFPEGRELVLIYTNGEFVKDLELTEAIQAMLADVGVTVRIETLEAGAYLERREQSDWDIAVNGAGASGGDLIFQLTLATGPVFGYANEAVTDLVLQAQQTAMEDQAVTAFAEAQELFWADVPYLWGFTQANTVAIRTRVQNLTPIATGYIPFHQATLSD